MQYGTNLALRDSIGVYLNIAYYTDLEDNYTVKATFVDVNHKPITTLDGTFTELLESGVATRYSANIITMPMANAFAFQMTDKIHVTISHLPENTVLFDFDYSIQQYCEDMIEDPATSNNLKELCKATLDYGGYSQTHFRYNINDLANANYSAGADVVTGTVIPDTYNIASITGNCTGMTPDLTGRALQVNTATELWFFFKPSEAYSNYSFKIDGVDAESELYSGVLLVRVRGIKSFELDKSYKVTITHTDGSSMTVTYSAMAYAYEQQDKTPETNANLCKALYRYFLAAKAYF
jgi:hypothetical protein